MSSRNLNISAFAWVVVGLMNAIIHQADDARNALLISTIFIVGASIVKAVTGSGTGAK